MSTTAQYASVPRNGVAQVSVANSNRDGTGTLALVVQASSKAGSGTRIDSIAVQAVGTTTVGMLRLYLQKGRPGAVISSLTFTGTTAVLTTVENHGLTTGHLISVIGTLPDEYNVIDAAVTVTGPKSLSYLMAVAPTADGVTLGNYSSSVAVPVIRLLREIPVTAASPSATVAAYSSVLSSQNVADKGYFPLVLQPGWSLRASTEKAESFNLIPTLAGDFL